MIYLKRRARWHMKGQAVNKVLAWKHIGLQLIVTKQSRKDWLIEVTPQVTVSHHDQIHFGLEVRWINASVSLFIPRGTFHEGLLKEVEIMEKYS